MKLIEDILTAFRHYGFATEVLVASVRNAEHVRRSLLLGAHIATIPHKVALELPKHELTDAGLKKFQDDWEAVKAAGAA